MIIVTIKGRISNVRFLENEGATKVRAGQYFAYQMPVANEASAVALSKRIEGDGYAWDGYEKCWCEWSAEVAEEAEEAEEPLYAGWASIAEQLRAKCKSATSATNEDCYLTMLAQLEALERKMYRKRADTRRLRAIMAELGAQSGAAAADYYTTVRDEIKGFAQTYW